MKDKIYIGRIGRILCQLDSHEIKDTIGINRLLKLYCKYFNEKLEKEIEDVKGGSDE